MGIPGRQAFLLAFPIPIKMHAMALDPAARSALSAALGPNQPRKVRRSFGRFTDRATAYKSASPEIKRQIRELAKLANRMFERTGVRHEVDHIVPLCKGGRHHPSNMRIITAAENQAKSGRMPLSHEMTPAALPRT